MLNYSEDFDGLDNLNELNSIAAGLLLGGGFTCLFDKLQVGLRADYYLDFTNIADWEMEQTSIEGLVKTNVFTVGVTMGYRL